MPGEELLPVVKAGSRAARKALDDSAEREMLQKLAADHPAMHAAASSYAVRVAVKQSLLLRLYQPFSRFIGISRTYFESEFQEDMAKKLAHVPDTDLTTPALSVAIPAIEGLRYSIDELQLKDMYLNLLATATDGRTSSRAHPAFAEIIKQLSPPEATMLLDVLRAEALPIAKLTRKVVEGAGFHPICAHLVGPSPEGSLDVQHDEMLAVWVDNWVRLGLITVDYDKKFKDETHYRFIQDHPAYLAAVAGDQRGAAAVGVDHGLLVPSDFGRQFHTAVSWDGVAVSDVLERDEPRFGE